MFDLEQFEITASKPSPAMPSIQYVDSHCHFDFSEFEADRERVWQRCIDRGVSTLLIPGVSPAQWPRAEQVARQCKRAYFAAGVHPWWIDDVFGTKGRDANTLSEAHLRELKNDIDPWLRSPRCIAVGECGLDKALATHFDIQLALLEWHCALAVEYRLPLVLHCHKAHAELIQVLKRYPLERGGVIHAFAGSAEIAKSYHKLGFCLGAGGVITYARAKKTRAAFAALPREAILLETDAPSMPLEGRQGSRNSPEYLPDIASALADIRKESSAELARYSSANFERVFLA